MRFFLPETVVLVFVNIFDAVYTATGIHLGLIVEGNPVMLLAIRHSGLIGLCIFKILWLILLLSIYEYSYHCLSFKYKDAIKIRHNLRVIAQIGIVIYIIWWLLGGWLICFALPAYGAIIGAS